MRTAAVHPSMEKHLRQEIHGNHPEKPKGACSVSGKNTCCPRYSAQILIGSTRSNTVEHIAGLVWLEVHPQNYRF